MATSQASTGPDHRKIIYDVIASSNEIVTNNISSTVQGFIHKIPDKFYSHSRIALRVNLLDLKQETNVQRLHLTNTV
uniref:Uncharacterized protein n=1 Tax=Pararge aegeria TaxID=116150 RepID=S4PS69_9NEOP